MPQASHNPCKFVAALRIQGITPAFGHDFPVYNALFDPYENARTAGICGRRGGGHAPSPFSCFSSSQAPYPSFPPRRVKTRSFRCSSSPQQNRCAGFCRGPHSRLPTAPKIDPNSLKRPFWGSYPPHPPRVLTAAHKGEEARKLDAH